MLDELVLQMVVGVVVECKNHNATCVHVEALNDERSLGMGILLSYHFLYIGQCVLSRYGKHAGWLLDDYDGGILVEDGDGLGYALEQRIGFDIETDEHVAEQWLALATACGIERPLSAYLAPGRGSHPELSHAERTEMKAICRLQKFGGTAVARARRREGIAKQSAYACRLASGIKEVVLREEPALEGDGTCLCLFGLAVANGGDVCLFFLEITARLHEVVDGVDEERLPRHAAQCAGKGSEEAQLCAF